MTKDLTGKTLERLVADAYRHMGATKVEHDVEIAGNQIDVYVELPAPGQSVLRIAVEVKDYDRPVGIQIVNNFAQIVDLLYRRRLIHEGVLVGASGFSKQARNAAAEHGLRLLEPADLKAMSGQPVVPISPSKEIVAPPERTPSRATKRTKKRIPDPQNAPTGEIRKLIQGAFNPKSLWRFCEEHPVFKDLRASFPYSGSLDDMTDVVFEFCRTRDEWEELLDSIAEHSPSLYNRTAARLGWPPVSESTPFLPSVRAELPVSLPIYDTYDDIELHVTPGPGGQPLVTLQAALAGDASDPLDQRWTDDESSTWLTQLELGDVNGDTLAAIGKQLFRALFHDHVRDSYAQARGATRTGLRLRLWFDVPELQALPWELLYDAGRHEFLALSGKTLITRYLSVPQGTPPLAVEPPLGLLIVSASPQDQPDIDVAAQESAVRDALAPLQAEGLVRVESLPHAQVMTLREALRDVRPHILHFVGHGAVERGGGALILEDGDGLSRPLSSSALRTMLQRTDVRLAVLNACLTARDADVERLSLDEQQALLGVGPALVRGGLGAVVAMQFSLSTRAAHLFAQDFYKTLARREPVDQAISRAREALMLELGEDRRDWATPVLFLRAPDGVIFAATR